MRRRMKRKELKAVLCSLAVMLLCMALPMTADAYTPRNHPSGVISPDGMGWTIYDPLPVEDYDAPLVSFWEPVGVEKSVTTGQPLDLVADKAGLGEHVYEYERTGEIPIYEWELKHADASCIHANNIYFDFHGIDTSVKDICGLAYWSGWYPVCANCGEYIAEALHYIKTDSIRQLDIYDVDMDYYYICPHNNHLEQGIHLKFHLCDALSANQYRVRYMPNCQTWDGEMDDSKHMYCNATHFEGEEVVPDRYLHKNSYTRKGYTFMGWATEPDGEVVYADQATRRFRGLGIYGFFVQSYPFCRLFLLKNKCFWA